MKNIILILLALMMFSCQKDYHKKSNNDLDQLLALMTGSFSSKKQSEMDKDYYDIRLEMSQIWPNSKDGKWLYVEQAVSTHLEKPYRQRVYHLTESSDGFFSSAVYELPKPEKFVGAHNNSSQFDTLTPNELKVRQGCAVLLKKINNHSYSGSTNPKSCLSTLRGATYATSVVSIDQQKILSWDRGFDANDEHVWGAEKGAYVFDKI